MPFIPSDDDPLGELGRFIVSPISLPYAAYLAMYDVYHGTSRSDPGENLRNAVVWGGAAAASWAYHAAMHPGKYGFVAGKDAFHLAAHYASTTPVLAAPIALAAPLALGYAANRVAISNAPTHEQPSLWRVVSQGLTGTGPGVGGWSP